MTAGNVLDRLPNGLSTPHSPIVTEGRSRRFNNISLNLALESDAFQHRLVGWLEALEI
jgi:hypothetical protein